MKSYAITIRATVTKTRTIRAEDEMDAEMMAHQYFTVACEGPDERYTQETLCIEEVEEVEEGSIPKGEKIDII